MRSGCCGCCAVTGADPWAIVTVTDVTGIYLTAIISDFYLPVMMDRWLSSTYLCF